MKLTDEIKALYTLGIETRKEFHSFIKKQGKFFYEGRFICDCDEKGEHLVVRHINNNLERRFNTLFHPDRYIFPVQHSSLKTSEACYTISACGEVIDIEWQNTKGLYRLRKQGLIFKSKLEAELLGERRVKELKKQGN